MDTANNPIVFYDIAMRPPVEKTCCSPNPWKSRLALNFKGVPYTTTWVPLPEIKNVRSGKGVAATRQFADGTDFYTLPMIEDPAHEGTKVGDSFDIAVYLQRTYPDSGAGNLLPDQPLDYSVGQELAFLIPLTDRRGGDFDNYAQFNLNVDAAFTAHVPLMAHGMPLDPATAPLTHAEFVRRAGVKSWDDFKVEGEARQKMKDSFRNTLAGLAAYFEKSGGPFVLGAQASYADFIIGGWVQMASRCLPAEEWEEIRGWHGGAWGRFYDALQQYAEVK